MKKIIINLLIALSLLITIPVYANDVNTFERTKENNYGVNKNWNITDSNLDNVLRTPYVDSKIKVYDFANILTIEEENELYEQINNFNKNVNMDMVILTVDFNYSYDKQNEDYAADFYDYNDFGMDFTNNSGVLFLRNVNTEGNDPYFNIYTFGDAQLYFTYERLEDTLDNIYYDIKNKNYLDGFSDFINDMNKYYNKGIPSNYKDYYVDEMGYLKYERHYHPPILIALIISGIITLITMLILVSKNKMVKKAVTASDYIDRKSINYKESQNIFVGTNTISHIIQTSSSSSGGGHSSHSGSSGGGHSSGGGRHG